MNPVSGLRSRGRSFIGRLSPGVWFITVTGFLNSAAFSISLPFIAIYLFDDRHISMTIVGIIILLGGVASAAVQLYAGALADRLGRRPLLIASVVAAGIFYLIMAFMVGLTAPVWTIVVVYTLVRSALMMQRPAIQAMIVDLCPREKLVEANGVLRIGQNLGWAFGPAIGGYLLVSISYSWLFGVAAFISIAIIFFVWSSIKETCHVVEEKMTLAGIFAATRNRSFLIFVILCIMLFLSMGQMGSTLSVFAVDRAHFTLEQYGSLLTLNGLIVVAFQYPVARLIARFRHSTALVFGSLLYALGWSLMGFVGSYALAIASMSVLTTGEIIIAPTSLAVVGVHAPAGKRGRYQGFFGISETLGVAIGPFMGGVLLDVFPTSNFFIWSVISVFAVLAAIGFLLWGRLFSRGRAVASRSTIVERNI